MPLKNFSTLSFEDRVLVDDRLVERGSLGRRWARARKTDLATVALERGEPLLLAQSTKGHFEGTDWAGPWSSFRPFGLTKTMAAVSGLVLSLSVTPGGAHDSTQLHPLVARARALCRDLRELLADAAYGGVGVRTATRDQHGVTVLAPPVANARKGDGLGKEDFAIDFAVMRATCPGGVATSEWRMTKEGGAETPMFTWSKESSAERTCADKCPVHRDRRRHLPVATTCHRLVAPGAARRTRSGPLSPEVR